MNPEKLKLVEQALWDGVKSGPESDVIVEPTWVQKTQRGARTAFLNGVYRCEISEEAAPAKVKATVDHYRKLGLPFRWKIGPSTKPANLRQVLKEEGMHHKETLFGLYAEATRLSIPVNPKVSVVALSQDNLEDWLQVQTSAWNVPPQGIAYMRQINAEGLAMGRLPYLNFLAYFEGRPVASASLRFYPQYALLMGAAVNPDCRKQGIYRTLLAHRMRLIGERGVPAVIHCLENTSAPICLKLGFEKVCEIQSFEMEF